MPIYENKVGPRDNSYSLAPQQVELLRLYRDYGKASRIANVTGKPAPYISKALVNIVYRLKVVTKQEALDKATKLGLI